MYQNNDVSNVHPNHYPSSTIDNYQEVEAENNISRRLKADREAFFAKERFKLHQAAPDEGVSIEILKKYIQKKYGI